MHTDLNKFTQNYDRPYRVLYGNNKWRITAIFILLAFAIFQFILIDYISFIMLISGLYCLSMIVFIKFPRIELYNDHFTIIRKSVVDRITTQQTFYYNEIEEAKFTEGFVNWGTVIFLSILGGISGGNLSPSKYHSTQAQPDIMTIKMRNREKVFIKRFGSRNDFKNIVAEINKKMQVSVL